MSTTTRCCETCEERASFWNYWWDGIKGRLVRGFLCADCADDAVTQGSVIGEDLFEIGGE